MTGLYDRQFDTMVERWRTEHPGQEPGETITATLRAQARMIVDDITRAQYLEEMELLYPSDD